MANILGDGSVVPSYLSTRRIGGYFSSGNFTNIAIRLGEVREVIYPTDKKNLSKTVIEYRVKVQERDGDGPTAGVEYPNCTVANLFGGSADLLKYTLRATDKSAAVGNGSKVLLACINGGSAQAIIIGGVRDDEVQDAKADGHNLAFAFNGVSADINKDGELEITFKGATKADGTLVDGVDNNASGTSLKFAKDGSLELSHADQHLTIDHPNKKVELVAAQELHLSGPSGVNIDSNATVKITAANIKVGGDAAVDAIVKGTTYRAAESTMHAAQIAALNAAAGALTAMAVSSTATAGTFVAITTDPAASSDIKSLAPIAAGMATTGPQMVAVAAALSAIAATISAFEAAAATFLSATNTVK